MRFQLPERLAMLVPYQPLTGDYPVRLDANESFLPPPDWLREEIGAAVSALDFQRYPDPYCERLCRAFADFYKVDPALVVAGNGSDELIGLIVSSFVGAGETMVTVEPDFSMYRFYAQMNDLSVQTYQKPDDLRLDTQGLAAFCREKKAKLLLFSNPCNPTSLCASRAQLLELAEALPECLVAADEAYMDFAAGSVIDMAGRYENLLVLKTCSKALGMAGIRLGFAVGAPMLTQALRAVKSPYNVNAMTQAAGCVLFSHPAYLEDCIQKIKASRDRLSAMLFQLAEGRSSVRSICNTQANFVFLHLSNAKQVFEKAAEQGVALRLMGDFLRITAGSEQENQTVVAVLDAIL